MSLSKKFKASLFRGLDACVDSLDPEDPAIASLLIATAVLASAGYFTPAEWHGVKTALYLSAGVPAIYAAVKTMSNAEEKYFEDNYRDLNP